MANLNTFVIDYCARQKINGTHLKYFVFKQLPVLAPSGYRKPAVWPAAEAVTEWIKRRVLELSYTAWDMEAFARDMSDDGPPFRWDEEPTDSNAG